MSWSAWGILGIIFFAAEVAFPGIFVFCFFGLGALVISLLVGLEVPISVELQYLLFSVVSVFLLFTLRKRFLSNSNNTLNPDDRSNFVGEVVHLSHPISAGATGKGQVRGTSWTVKNISDAEISTGSSAKVISVSGLTLEIK